MARRLSIIGSMVILALSISVSEPSAQGVFTFAGDVLTLSPSTRSYGIGFTGVADICDPANTYSNPATISFLSGVYLSGAYSKLIPEISEIKFYSIGSAGGYRFSTASSQNLFLTGSIRYNLLDYGEYEDRTAENEPFTYHAKQHNLCFTLAGGIIVANNLYAGLGFTLKPLWSSGFNMPDRDYNFDSFAFDFGMLIGVETTYESGVTVRPTLGMSVVNIGSAISYPELYEQFDAPLPKQFRYGFGLRIEAAGIPSWDEAMGAETPLVSFSGNFDVIDNIISGYDLDNAYGFGAEIGFLQIIFMRYGLYNSEYSNSWDSTYGFGAGLTYEQFVFRFDYASWPLLSEELDNSKKYGLTLGMLF
jgi:hypothetical protein